MGRIPKRWLPYQAVGECIAGTRFVAFKVPLREAACRVLPEKDRFTLRNLVEKVSLLGLVIDLTNTDRYYNPGELKNWDIDYAKIYTAGQKVPNTSVVTQFFQIVDEFLEKNPDNGKLIGVHCTHGVNRTGYLVCRYMVDKLSQNPTVAIKAFHTARGHKIERQEYVDSLVMEVKTSPAENANVGNSNSSSSWFCGDGGKSSWLPGRSSTWTPDVRRPITNKSELRVIPERTRERRSDPKTNSFKSEICNRSGVSSTTSYRRHFVDESSKKRKSPTQSHRECDKRRDVEGSKKINTSSSLGYSRRRNDEKEKSQSCSTTSSSSSKRGRNQKKN